MRLEKDHEHPNLYFYPEAGTYYFRKYTTETGEIFRSLRERNRYKAILKMNRLLADLEKRKAKGRYLIDDAILELYDIKRMQAQSTFENLEHYCRAYITPYFSGTPINEVARQWEPFKAHVKKLKPGMSLIHIRRHLTTILNHAVNRGELESFPRLKLDKAEMIKGTPRAYERDEVKKILTGKPKGDHKFKKGTIEKQRLMIRLTLDCGLRPPQEIRLLKKEYFDFKRRTLTLPAHIVKTRLSRPIPVPPDLLAEVKAFGDKNPGPYIFPMRGNPNMPATRSDKTWQRLKRALGFSGKRYWFRHSHATAAIQGGENAIVVAKDMGTSVEMLERIYVRPDEKATARRVALVRKKYGVGE